MTWKQRLRAGIVSQFHRPDGVFGWLVGWEMALRRSNRRRNRWAVSLLNIQPTDRFLEIGFGPGLAIREAASLATRGSVVGVDHSAEMVRQATKRNRAAVRKKRVRLYQADADSLPDFESPFNKVLAVNSLGFWPHPVDRLAELRSIMSEAGIIAIVSQPRCPGANREHTDRAESEIRQLLQRAGFAVLRSDRLDLDPPVTCVLATIASDGVVSQPESQLVPPT